MINYENSLIAYKKIQDSSLNELKILLFKAAVRYANIRAEWSFLTLEERKEQDEERTAAHNRFIDACNILARNMRKADEDSSWAELISKDRKEIGDFACYLHTFLGIKNR